MIHVSLCRLDLTQTTGQLSITSSYGGVCLCTLQFYLQCTVMAYLASFQVISHSLVSFAQCETCERKIYSCMEIDHKQNWVYVSSGTARNCLSEKSVWLVILLTTVVCVIPGVAVSFLRVNLFPTLTDKVSIHSLSACVYKIHVQNFINCSPVTEYQQVRYLQQSSKKQGPQEQNLRRVRRTSSRRSAYAFSHQQGYGELITSGKNMRMNTVSSARSPGKTAQSSTWIENILKRKNEISCTSNESSGAPESSSRAIQTPEQQHTD